jgi:hypothetical protein
VPDKNNIREIEMLSCNGFPNGWGYSAGYRIPRAEQCQVALDA